MEKEVKYENSKKNAEACIEWYEKCTIERCSPDNQVALREVGNIEWNKYCGKNDIKCKTKNPWEEFETYLLLKVFKKDYDGNIILEKKSPEQDDEKNRNKTYKVNMAAARSAEYFVGYISNTFRDVVRERIRSDFASINSKGKFKKKFKCESYNDDMKTPQSTDSTSCDDDFDDYEKSQDMSSSIENDNTSRSFNFNDYKNEFDSNEFDPWCPDLDEYEEDVEVDFEEDIEQDTNEDTEQDTKKEYPSDIDGARSQLDDYYNPERNIQRTISQIEQDSLVAPIIKDLKKWLSNEDNVEYVKVCANLIQLNDGSKNENIENRDEEQLEKDKKLLSDVKQNPKNYGLGRNKSATYAAINKARKLLEELRKILSEEDYSTVIKEYFNF